MNKWICRAAALSLMFFSLSTAVNAEHYDGDEGFYVTYTTKEKLESNFSNGQMDDIISGMEPGDDVTFTIEVRNEFKEPVDYYVKNTIIKSFEDGDEDAANGLYGYELTYYDADGNANVIYSSATVGGEEGFDGRYGLYEATDAMEEYFHLDKLASGKTGKLVLNVSLDGETLGNAYQDTMAQLSIQFAAEKDGVPTGDPTRTMPYWIAAGVSGLVILGIVLFRIRSEKKEENE